MSICTLNSIKQMLFVEVAIYCISTLPFPINTVYASVTMNVSKSKDRAAIDSFLTFLTGSILQYMNASTAMYSNLATSVVFRDALKKLFVHRMRLGCIFKTEGRKQPTLAMATYINDAYDNGALEQKQKMGRSVVTRALPRSVHATEKM